MEILNHVFQSLLAAKYLKHFFTAVKHCAPGFPMQKRIIFVRNLGQSNPLMQRCSCMLLVLEFILLWCVTFVFVCADPLDAPHRFCQQLRRWPLPLLLRLPPAVSSLKNLLGLASRLVL